MKEHKQYDRSPYLSCAIFNYVMAKNSLFFTDLTGIIIDRRKFDVFIDSVKIKNCKNIDKVHSYDNKLLLSLVTRNPSI
jgi:hypothetical protein